MVQNEHNADFQPDRDITDDDEVLFLQRLIENLRLQQQRAEQRLSRLAPDTDTPRSNGRLPTPPADTNPHGHFRVGARVSFRRTNITPAGTGTVARFSHDLSRVIIIRDSDRTEIQRAPHNVRHAN